MKPGKHAVIVGQNGSGKSQMLIRLALDNEQKIVVFDTKKDDDFLHLARGKEKTRVVNGFKEFVTALKKPDFDFLVVRPQIFELNNPTALDNYLLYIATNEKHLTICIDEAYPFHSGSGRAGAGLVGILTRGRSNELSLICCTQRPSFVSTFIFSESTYFFIYRLLREKDRKAVAEIIPYNREIPANFHYYFYDLSEGGSQCELCEPIKLFKRAKPSSPARLTLLNFSRT